MISDLPLVLRLDAPHAVPTGAPHDSERDHGSYRTTPMRTCLVAVQISLLLSLFACGTDGSDPGATTINLSLAIRETVAQEHRDHASWWAKLSQWLPSTGVAWAQVSEIGQLRIEIFASNGTKLANQTVPVTDRTSGQMIAVSVKVPSGPQRRISVSALNAAGTKLYSGRKDTDLTPGAAISVEIALAPTFEVTITVVPPGSGTVRSSPPGVECKATCSARLDSDTKVALTAIPEADWSFVQWGEACTGQGDCTVDKTSTVSAQFRDTRTPLLTLTKTGPLATSGTVISMPAGINCGTDCAEPFAIGTSVTLSTSQNGGVLFSGWSGGGCSGPGPCTVTVTEDRSISARFDVAPGYTLIELVKTGTGTGTVTSDPAGISCGIVCSAGFRSASFVPRLITLLATPAAASTFGGWSGVTTCGSDPTCVMFVLGDQTISAQFNLVQTD